MGAKDDGPKVRELTEDEAERAFAGEDVEEASEPTDAVEDADENAEDANPLDASGDGPPAWAVMPANVKLPPQGITVQYVRIPAKWTTNPKEGDQWCACWQLSELDERQAAVRARGDDSRFRAEQAKQMIRVVNGVRADWTKKPGAKGDVDRFWGSIGPKGRSILKMIWLQTHIPTAEEVALFFGKHFVVATVSAD